MTSPNPTPPNVAHDTGRAYDVASAYSTVVGTSDLTTWAAVHDALVTALTDGLSVPVFDTMPNTEDYLPDSVVVGGDIDPMDPTSGEFSGDVHDMGGPFSSRKEFGFVRVAIVSTDGDATFSQLRARCFAIGEEVAYILRTDVTFGVLAGRMVPQLREIKGKSSAGVGEAGPWVDLVLQVNFEAII